MEYSPLSPFENWYKLLLMISSLIDMINTERKHFDKLWFTDTAAQVLVSNHKILKVNEKWKQSFLFEEKEALNRSLKIMEGPLTQMSNILELQEASQSGMKMQRTVTLYCRDGSPQVTVVEVNPVLSDKRFEGNALSIWQMKTSCAVMEKDFSFSQDVAQVITEVQSPFRIVKANKMWCERCEFTGDEIIGKTLEIIQGPSTSRDTLSALSASITQGIGFKTTLVNYTKSKVPILNQLNIFPMLCDKSGFPSHFVGNMEISCHPDFQEIEKSPYPCSIVLADYPHKVVVSNSLWQQCNVLQSVKQVYLRESKSEDRKDEQRLVETIFVTEDLKRFVTRARILNLNKYGSNLVTHYVLVFEHWGDDKQNRITSPCIAPCEDQVTIQEDGSVRLVIGRKVVEHSNIEASLLDEFLSCKLLVSWNVIGDHLHVVVPPNVLTDTVSSDWCHELARDLGKWYSWWIRVLWLHSMYNNGEMKVSDSNTSDDSDVLTNQVMRDSTATAHVDLESKRFCHGSAWGTFWKDSYFFKHQVKIQMSSPVLEGHEEILESMQRQGYVSSWEQEDEALDIFVNAAQVLQDCQGVPWISQWKVGLDRWEGWWIHFLWLHYRHEDVKELTATCLHLLDDLQLMKVIESKNEPMCLEQEADVHGTTTDLQIFPVGHGTLRFLHEEILKQINAMGYFIEWKFSDDESELFIRASLGIFHQADCAWTATWANDQASGDCWLDRIKFLVGSQNHLTRKYAVLDECSAISDTATDARTFIIPRGILSQEKRDLGLSRLFERGLILDWSWETEETIRVVVQKDFLQNHGNASLWCNKWISKSYPKYSWVPVWLCLLWLMNVDEEFASETSSWERETDLEACLCSLILDGLYVFDE